MMANTKNTRPKFKVIELDWYCDFKRFLLDVGNDMSDEECYQACKLLAEESGHDGPLGYIEECEDPGFPPRIGLKYCIRTSKKCVSGNYKPYECYCYQAGRWWKYKDDDTLFTEVYVPQIMSHYEYAKYDSPLRLLSKTAYNDWIYHQRQHELHHISRSARQWRFSILGK